MASSSTTLQKGDNLPPRGRAKKTLILEAIRDKALAGMSKDSTHEECEKAFFGEIAGRAFNRDDQSSGMLLKFLGDKGWASVKPVMESVDFTLDETVSISKQARQIMAAVSREGLPPDVAKMLIDSLANMLKIAEITELEDRIKSLEEKQDER